MQLKEVLLSLYAYQLAEYFDEGLQTPAENEIIKKELWENFADRVAVQLNLPELQNLRNLLKIYQPNNPPTEIHSGWENLLVNNSPNLNLSATSTLRGGSFRAQKIQDTYVADLSLFYKENTLILPQDLQQLNPNGCLLQNHLKASIGQTILLYAEPIFEGDRGADEENYQKLAEACIQGLINDTIKPSLRLVNTGEWLGSPVFEYDNGEFNPQFQCHVLVWLARNPDSLEKQKKEFDFRIQNLFLYRHKVLYAYYQGREWYAAGQREASTLETKLPTFSNFIEKEPEPEIRLQKLKQLLADTHKQGVEYSKCLRLVRDEYNTIAINTENFTEALKDLQTLKLEADDFGLWKKFLDLAQNKYLKQLEVDLNYLIAGQNLFQDLVANIRGNLEIEQIEAEREIQENLIEQVTESRNLQEALLDLQGELQENSEKDAISSRNLNITIAVVGTGMAGAGVVASSYELIKPEKPLLMPWDINAHGLHPFTISIGISLLIGLIPALLWLLVLSYLKSKNSRN
ncbi:MAG: hypothetical protein ACM37W_06915 [Actinomycetota bacterium]